MIILKYLEDILDLSKEISRQHPENLLLYRGQSDSSKNLMPSLFRVQRESWFEHEQMHFLKASKFVCEESDLEIAIHAQHYSYSTRLLDVSYSSLIGLFFACYDPFSKNINRDGKVFIISSSRYLPPTSPELMKLYSNIINNKKVFDSLIFYSTPIVIENIKNNDRIIAQHGAFLLYINREQESKYTALDIKMEHKQSVLYELDKYFNINEGTVFPDIEKNVSRFINNHVNTEIKGSITKDIMESIIYENIEQYLRKFEFDIIPSEEKEQVWGRYYRKLLIFVKDCFDAYGKDRVRTESKMIKERMLRICTDNLIELEMDCIEQYGGNYD
jgi:hypothetical protein